MKYRVFAALHDESNLGWVWLPTSTIAKRGLVRLSKPESSRRVYCEARTIDPLFAKQYNKETTIHIDANSNDTIVVGRWYRDALGLVLQEEVEIRIEFPKVRDWGALRAGAHHPDALVRISTRLWILASWLSLTGVLLTLASLVSSKLVSWAGILAILGGLIGLVSCRGVRQE